MLIIGREVVVPSDNTGVQVLDSNMTQAAGTSSDHHNYTTGAGDFTKTADVHNSGVNTNFVSDSDDESVSSQECCVFSGERSSSPSLSCSLPTCRHSANIDTRTPSARGNSFSVEAVIETTRSVHWGLIRLGKKCVYNKDVICRSIKISRSVCTQKEKQVLNA